VIGLSRHGDLFVLDLGEGDHRFNPDAIAALGDALDQVEAAPAPRALVTVATGKIWHNGLDLEWLGGHPDQVTEFVQSIQALLARVLVLPVPTVAAVQGHAFGAGAMLALVHDTRFMRADRGFFCLPEVDIQVPFTPGMAALVQARLTPSVAHQAMTTGRRYGGTDAAALGIAAAALAEDELRPAAFALARSLADKDPRTLGTIKEVAERRTRAALLDATPLG
jgi:enoyl-CoA hydratase/carnithine racemase